MTKYTIATGVYFDAFTDGDGYFVPSTEVITGYIDMGSVNSTTLMINGLVCGAPGDTETPLIDLGDGTGTYFRVSHGRVEGAADAIKAYGDGTTIVNWRTIASDKMAIEIVGAANSVIENLGLISGEIAACITNTRSDITNSGVIEGDSAAVLFHQSTGAVTNLNGGVIRATDTGSAAIKVVWDGASTAATKVTNFGRIEAAPDGLAIEGDDGRELVRNIGTIDGTVSLGGGNDRFNGRAAEAGNDVDAGAGNDNVKGGDFADTLIGGTGTDVLSGGGGDDQIDGGADNDTLYGHDGNDTLLGGAGNDLIRAGGDDDIIIGGTGRDTMEGQRGADQFVFQSATESRTGSARDVIVDFDGSEDLIVLTDVSAQTMTFNGTDGLLGGGVASVAYTQLGANSLVSVDADGDGAADMELWMQGVTTLEADDFVL